MMKNKKYIVMLALTLLTGIATKAQQPGQDSTPGNAAVTEDAVIESNGNLSFDSRIAAGSNSKVDVPPSFSSTCDWFVEAKLMFPTLVGYGIQAAYVPKHWGAYASLMGAEGYRTFSDSRGALYDDYVHYTWLTGGAVFRPLLNPYSLDFQLFGGLAMGYGGGAEFGIRLAGLEGGHFSWFSGSFGIINTNHDSYITIGISIGISAMMGSIIIL